jgi:hypothetical protein
MLLDKLFGMRSSGVSPAERWEGGKSARVSWDACEIRDPGFERGDEMKWNMKAALAESAAYLDSNGDDGDAPPDFRAIAKRYKIGVDAIYPLFRFALLDQASAVDSVYNGPARWVSFLC